MKRATTWVWCCLLMVELLANLNCHAKDSAYAQTATQNHDSAKPLGTTKTLNPNWLGLIQLETVHPTQAPIFLNTTGRVVFDEEHTQYVGAPVDGRVVNVLAPLGSAVRLNQPLVELSSAEVVQLQAEVKKSLQDLDIAIKSWERMRRLKDDGAISEKEASQITADLQKARVEVERGQAQLAALGIHTSDPVVRVALYARMAGTVVDRSITLGQEVRADSGMPLLTISNLDTLWVLADVYEPDIAHIQVGARVHVHVPAYPAEIFTGKIGYIGQVLDAQSRTVKVRCVVPNPQHKLKPEMFATLELEKPSTTTAILIPPEAVINDNQVTYVFTIGAEQQIIPQVVRLGVRYDNRERVLDGLKENDIIVGKGAIFLQKALAE